MTILEAEKLTGLDRATIRYYESEGLISPLREKNGYRNYSDGDTGLLLRVRLLRELGMPLNEINCILNGSTELISALDEHIMRLQHAMEQADSSMKVCREMVDDRASFETLDAKRYLDALEHVRPANNPLNHLISDRTPRVFNPWRRYFARMLDFTLYELIWQAVLMLLFRVRYTGETGQTLLANFIIIILALIFEPLFLHFFGTTPGKWILGISMTDDFGRKPLYSQAFFRTASVLWHGLGFFIPVYGLVRLWKCRRAVNNRDELPWDEYAVLELHDERALRTVAYIGCVALCTFLTVLLFSSAQMPRHRGSLTPEEFAANFNDLAGYYEYELEYSLNSDGTWTGDYLKNGGTVEGDMIKYDYGTSEVFSTVPTSPQDMSFTVEDGVLTGVSFVTEGNSDLHKLSLCRTELLISALSFVGAQRDIHILTNDISGLAKLCELNEFTGFSFSMAGVSVVCEAQQEGYYDFGGYLVPDDSFS